jgi:hypothetical protein
MASKYSITFSSSAVAADHGELENPELAQDNGAEGQA